MVSSGDCWALAEFCRLWVPIKLFFIVWVFYGLNRNIKHFSFLLHCYLTYREQLSFPKLSNYSFSFCISSTSSKDFTKIAKINLIVLQPIYVTVSNCCVGKVTEFIGPNVVCVRCWRMMWYILFWLRLLHLGHILVTSQMLGRYHWNLIERGGGGRGREERGREGERDRGERDRGGETETLVEMRTNTTPTKIDDKISIVII